MIRTFLYFKKHPYSLSIEYKGRLLLNEIKVLTVITKYEPRFHARTSHRTDQEIAILTKELQLCRKQKLL